MSEEKKEKAVSRRKYLGAVGGLAAAAVVGWGLAGYLASRPPAPGVVKTITETKTITATPTAPVTTPVTKPIIFAHWAYRPDIVTDNVKKFEELYGVKVTENVYTENYNAITESSFIAGEGPDICYMQDFNREKWYRAGWIQSISDIPGAMEHAKMMIPTIRPMYESAEGELLGMPYYIAFQTLQYNGKIFDELGLTLPKTWDDVYKLCKESKGKTTSFGKLDYPFAPNWEKDFEHFSEFVFGMAYTLADDDPFFAIDGRKVTPIMDSRPECEYILEWCRTMYKEGLVPPIALTWKWSDALGAFRGGTALFFLWHHYYLKTTNDPAASKIAPYGKFVPPIEKGGAMNLGSMHVMGGHVKEPLRTAVYNLMEFLGGKCKKTGRYEGQKRWMIEEGLLSPYPELLNDPEVAEGFNKWTDYNTLRSIFERSRARVVIREPWFVDWSVYFQDQAHLAIKGEITPKEALSRSATKAKELISKTGGS
jgi:multiple sugar transport system substrate-binding protein